MAHAKQVALDRPLRVALAVLVRFESDSFTVRDFTLDLSVGGIFLLTENECPWGTDGTMTFRTSQFEEPFTVRGRVVRIVSAEQTKQGFRQGLGIEFVDVSEDTRKKLQRLVDGVRNGSVVEAIRASIRDTDQTLDTELRRRPVDQKLMLALNARHDEIAALIRDGNPIVMIRLLECPRLTPANTVQMLRNRTLPTRVLSAVFRYTSKGSNEETRWLFVTHPNAMFSEVMVELKKLSTAKLRQLALDTNVRQNVRLKAREWLSRAAGARSG